MGLSPASLSVRPSKNNSLKITLSPNPDTTLNPYLADNFLCFAKVNKSIWDAVGNMSKVSAKSAETIYHISKKSEQHKEALIDIAEEIKKGAGSKRIEKLVHNIILGEKQNYNDDTIQSPDGTVFANWKNDKLQFSKNANIDKKEISQYLLKFFISNNT